MMGLVHSQRTINIYFGGGRGEGNRAADNYIFPDYVELALVRIVLDFAHLSPIISDTW